MNGIMHRREISETVRDTMGILHTASDFATSKSHNHEKCGRKVCIFLMGLVLASIQSSLAQFITTQQIGDFTFSSGTDANGNWISGSSVKVGDSIFHNYNSSEGVSANGTTINIGNSAYHNLTTSDGTTVDGSSLWIGDMGFHNFSDSNGKTFNGTSLVIGGTKFSEMNVFEQNGIQENIRPNAFSNDESEPCFMPANFTFGERGKSQDYDCRQSHDFSDIDPNIQIFDPNTNTITAAGVLVQPNTRMENCKSWLTLDELHARAADAVRNKHFVMIAHVAMIYNNTHRVLLDTCDTIQFSASEFKKIQTKWKVGDLVSVSEWVDDRGDFVDYELTVYGKSSARGEVVDE